MADREWLFDLEGHTVILVAAINGLVSEVSKVKAALEKYRPDGMGISVTGGQLDRLREWNGSGEPVQPEYTEFDLFYIREMSKFGEVVLPSPAQLYPVAFADAAGIDVVALDMNDDEYTELYMEHVSASSLFIDSIFRRGRMRRSFEGTPEEVVLKIDSVGRHPRGVAMLDAEREKHIAGEILRKAAEYSVFMAVVDYERADGVRRELERRKH